MKKPARRAQSVSTKRRLSPTRAPGIATQSDAPFWQGRRAEHVVAERVEAAQAEKAQKLAERAARRNTKGPRAKRERTPHQQLRRLERALLRRKTLDGRQRVQAQIDQLKRELARA